MAVPNLGDEEVGRLPQEIKEARPDQPPPAPEGGQGLLGLRAPVPTLTPEVGMRELDAMRIMLVAHRTRPQGLVASATGLLRPGQKCREEMDVY